MLQAPPEPGPPASPFGSLSSSATREPGPSRCLPSTAVSSTAAREIPAAAPARGERYLPATFAIGGTTCVAETTVPRHPPLPHPRRPGRRPEPVSEINVAQPPVSE